MFNSVHRTVRESAFPEHEPKRLIVSRLITAFLLFLALVATFVLLLPPALREPTGYDTTTITTPLKVPAMILYSTNGLFSGKTGISGNSSTGASRYPEIDVSAYGAAYYNDGTPDYRVRDISTSFQKWRWGNDCIISKSEPIPVTDSAGSTTIHAFMPNPDWRFTVNGVNDRRLRNSTKINMSAMEIKLSVKNVNLSAISWMLPQGFLKIAFLEDAGKAEAMRTNGSTIDLSQITGQARAFAMWGNIAEVTYQQRIVKSSASTSVTKFETQIIGTTSADNTSMILRVSPSNSISGNNYEVPESTPQPNYALLRLFSTMGGAFALALSIFRFLFGQRRLRPWGVIQQFFMRNRILVALPPAVAQVRSFTQPQIPKKTSLDSAIGNKDTDDGQDFVSTVALSSKQDSTPKDTITCGNEGASLPYENLSPELSSIFASYARELQSLQDIVKEQAIELSRLKEAAPSEQTTHAHRSDTCDDAHDSSDSQLKRSTGAVSFLAARVDRLEAFHQRMETMYLATDLFNQDGKVKKRSTLQVIAGLNI
ncbi:hypothetical protein THASP1DRAFT_27942 [Thamnocephalis sphaerospora]|uniref:Uncharacterized protein n=1 Tax=Thamnocephalis sphaerospora TaxID=78915 RepID=A0A4P9XVF7_9FUNG|nr:hypothetical protein THASP1DRAFT_27942 [Thamnocephalis sphaerospora]|eukprot:RKP10257.1 hypothetical protein THASP1DRAFT_27942 [Thamnocephalis sphaerospora]